MLAGAVGRVSVVLPAPATVARAITGADGTGPPVGGGADGWTGADTVAITGWLPVTVPTALGGGGAPATTGTVADDDVAGDEVGAADAAAGDVIRIVASEALDTGVGSGVFAPATGLGAGLGGADGVVGVGSGGFTPGAPVPATGVGTGRLTGAVATAGADGGRLTAVGPVRGPLPIGALVEAAPDAATADAPDPDAPDPEPPDPDATAPEPAAPDVIVSVASAPPLG